MYFNCVYRLHTHARLKVHITNIYSFAKIKIFSYYVITCHREADSCIYTLETHTSMREMLLNYP